MPLYEYECQSCGNRFELIQRFSDPPAEHCPKCGGRVKKLMSSPAIHFKGTGWYVTDYARKQGTGGEKADPGSTSTGDSTSTAPRSETTESKGTESKSAESKSTEAKTTESKSTESGGSGSGNKPD